MNIEGCIGILVFENLCLQKSKLSYINNKIKNPFSQKISKNFFFTYDPNLQMGGHVPKN